jgi:hypothetical protein
VLRHNGGRGYCSISEEAAILVKVLRVAHVCIYRIEYLRKWPEGHSHECGRTRKDGNGCHYKHEEPGKAGSWILLMPRTGARMVGQQCVHDDEDHDDEDATGCHGYGCAVFLCQR